MAGTSCSSRPIPLRDGISGSFPCKASATRFPISRLDSTSTARRSHPTVDGWSTRRTPPEGRRSMRSEEHTSELQSLRHLVCRLLLEKKKKKKRTKSKTTMKIQTESTKHQ